jgi:hypothetical protein
MWCRMSKGGVCSYTRSREMFVALDERDWRMWCRMSKGDVCSYGWLREVFVALDDREGHMTLDVQGRCM